MEKERVSLWKNKEGLIWRSGPDGLLFCSPKIQTDYSMGDFNQITSKIAFPISYDLSGENIVCMAIWIGFIWYS